MKNRVSGFIACNALILHCSISNAQDNKPLKDEPGTFKITTGTLNDQVPDQYMKSCGYTNAEAAKKNLVALIGICRSCPLSKEIKGFDGIGDLYEGRCNTKFGYGLPSTVCIYFEIWTLWKGKEVKQTSEPLQWHSEVNMTEKFCSNGFNVSDYCNKHNPSTPTFSQVDINKSAVALRELFILPGVKTEVCPGTDRFGDNPIIVNPDRPVYWSEVTIRETSRLFYLWVIINCYLIKSRWKRLFPCWKMNFQIFQKLKKTDLPFSGTRNPFPGSIQNQIMRL